MKKIIFSILAISTLFLINVNVSALSLSMPTGYAHESFRPVGENVKLPIVESSNSFGYANYAMDFIRNKSLHDPDTNTIYYNTFYNWYGFVFNNLKHDCGNSSVLLKGVFVTWTNYIPGTFSSAPYVIFTNSNNENTNCSIVSSNNSNILEFSCLIENMTSSGSFNIGFNDPGPTFNGSIYLESYNTYIGISKNLDISCQISTSDVVNIQNQNKNEIINNQNQNSQEIINNQNNNTNSIIGSAAQNTTEIINNQIKNNEELKNTINDNFNNCRESKNLLNMPYLENNKFTYTATKDDDYKSTDFYVYLEAGKQYTFSVETTGTFGNRNEDTEIYLLFDKKYDYIIHMDSKNGYTFTPNRTGNYYIRYDVNKNGDTQSFWNFQIVEGSQNIPFEKYGEKICSNKIDETNNQLGDLNNNLTDSNIDSSSANGFFSNFKDDDYGLSNIIIAPLNFIKNLNNNQCSELSIPIPYLNNQNLKLPCMSIYYKSNFNSLFTLYQNITTGFIAYWVAIRIYALIKSFKDPEDDKIEVLDL